MNVVEQEGRDVLAPDGGGLCRVERLDEQLVVHAGIELGILGQRVRHEDAARQSEGVVRTHDVGDLLGAAHGAVHREAAIGEPERREAVRAKHEHGDTEALQPLERRADVEDRLDATGDDRDRTASENPEVGRLVERGAGVSVDPADPTGREHADTRLCREQGCCRDGRTSGRTLCQGHRQISGAELDGAVGTGQPLEIVGFKPHMRHPVQDRDRRGHGAAIGDGPLELERRTKIVRPRKPVGDDRRFERDDGRAVTQRVGNVLGENRSVISRAHRSIVMMSDMDRDNATREAPRPLSICTIGDLILDVIVLPRGPLVPDADMPAEIRFAAGGQAANVAAWASALGARSRLICKRGSDSSDQLAAAELSRHGVEVCGPTVAGRGGVVVSVRDVHGQRTMASDRGVASLLEASELDPAWVESADVLHVSGYCLFREPMAGAVIEAARLARRVTVDLASAPDIELVGADTITARLEALDPELVFATEAERAAVPEFDGRWVIKLGAAGASFPEGRYPAPAVEVVDTTGAGDALAAGYLVGGPKCAIEAAARCITIVGATPLE